MKFTGRGILLDIEGTTSSVRFVYDVMFPFVDRALDRFLTAEWGTNPDLWRAIEQMAREIDGGRNQYTSAQEWIIDEAGMQFSPSNMPPLELQQELIANTVRNDMWADRKTTGLKMLQGLIWQSGFASGELQAHVYEDVPPALSAWNAAGKDVRIYSSGSVQAQKLFFGHTTAGDLLQLFRGHYDTTTGPKKNATSYQRIAADYRVPPDEILFLSDIVAELDAARAAGMQTALVVRPGNATDQPSSHGPHEMIASFAQIEM